MKPKALSIVAKSGTGKTTLLEKLIKELKIRGFRVGAIKHDAHSFEIDHPGKDSYRLARAGADSTLICSADKLALIKVLDDEPTLDEIITRYFPDVDIVLTEGFKRCSLPKIEVHRLERGAGLQLRGESDDPSLIAVASDSAFDLDVPLFDIDDAGAIADFIEGKFLSNTI